MKTKAVRTCKEVSLDSNGRCCGIEPAESYNDKSLFCVRCNSEYDIKTGKQVENWAWMKHGSGFVWRCRMCGEKPGMYRECYDCRREILCDECFEKHAKQNKVIN